MKRRTFLGAAAGTALAGCLGSADPDRDEHPAAQRLVGSPWLGAPPDETDRLIVAFEDPSCSTCRRFHESAFRALRRDLLESGIAGFVYRPYPIVLTWGQSATQAVLATADRDQSVAWTLIDYYYAAQDTFNSANVVRMTRDHLDAETDVDGTAIVEDVRSNAYNNGIKSALEDGDAAEATTTPTFFSFVESGSSPNSRAFRTLRCSPRHGRYNCVDDSLPTTRNDWRLIVRTMRLVLRQPTYALFSAVNSAVALTGLVLSLNVPFAHNVLLGSELPITSRFELLVLQYPFVGPLFSLAQGSILIGIGILVGIDIALLVYHLREHRVSVRGGSGSSQTGCAVAGSMVARSIRSPTRSIARNVPIEKSRRSRREDRHSFPLSTFAAVNTGSHVVLNGGAYARS